MLLKPEDTPPSFFDPAIQEQAQQGLNRLVLGLMRRMVQPEQTLPTRIGALHVIQDPALAEQVFKTPAQFRKNFALLAAMGESRFNLNGDRWAQFRDRTQPAYNRASKPQERPDIEAIYSAALDRVPTDDANGLERALVAASLAVFGKALGISPDPAAILRLFPHIRSHAMLLQYFSWSDAREPDVLLQRAEWLDQRFAMVVMADPQTRDFIGQAIAGLPPDEVSPAITDLMQNLFAGIETTVATLSWAVQLLGQNATLQDALRAEASAMHRPLTRSFLWETMRCFPPIPFVVRELAFGYTGHGRHFASGDQVIVSILGLHRHPDHWDQPNQFRAARREFAADQPTPLAFRPFLSGPRVCGGKRLAELELLSALPQILLRWRIVSDSADVAYDYALALRPHTLGGVRLQALQ